MILNQILYGNFLWEETSSLGSLDTLISNVSGRVNRVEVLMPPPSLLEEEVHVNLQMRDLTRDFIQTLLENVSRTPSNIEVLEHLNL